MKIFTFSHIFGFCFLFLTMLYSLHSYTEEAVPKESDTSPVSESKEIPNLNEEQKDEMTEFLIKEVIPAFGGLQHFQLNQPPSFYLHFTPEGIQLTKCSFNFQIQQLESIQYNLAQVDLHDFQANAHIGQSESFLFFDVSCGDQSNVINGFHLNADISIKDKNSEPSYYGITIHSLGQEQLSLKILSINIDIKIQNDAKWTLQDSRKKVVFVKSIQTHPHFPLEILEEKSTTNFYSIPQEVWPYTYPDVEAIQVTKAQTTQIISLEGTVRYSLPISVNGQRQETEVSIPINGNIFAFEKESAEGNPETIYIPNIHFSSQQAH